MLGIRRREFITMFGGAAATWPRAARAQLGDRVRRIGVISAALRNKVPTIMDISAFAREGGLISYGSNNADSFRRSAGYVDRILRGAIPADLPVQVPVLFELLINASGARKATRRGRPRAGTA